MDQVIIGKFIAVERKQKGYTQKQLAEELNISDKTISKWETGKGFPEISLLVPLCSCLDITVNELLAGQRLLENEYKRKAEENMVSMIKEKELNQKNFRITNFVGGVSSLSFIAIMIVVGIFGKSFPFPALITLIAVAGGIFIMGLYVATTGERTIGYYKCPYCGEHFVPTQSEYMKGAHFWSKRRLKCPNCDNVVWARKTMSLED